MQNLIFPYTCISADKGMVLYNLSLYNKITENNLIINFIDIACDLPDLSNTSFKKYFMEILIYKCLILHKQTTKTQDKSY